MTDKYSPFPRIRPELRRPLVAMLDRAPPFLFMAALMLAAFAGGMYVYKEKVFPYGLFRDAWKTGVTLYRTHVSVHPFVPRKPPPSVDVPPGRMEAHRFEFIGADALVDPILVPGNVKAFSEYCPGAIGCLAVEYAGRGELVHAWPYRPDEIENASVIADFPYEVVPGFSFSRHARPEGISRYANGDLLVVFYFKHTFPHAGGVARIDRDGRVLWYRRDYSHHVPHLADGDVALVPGMRIGEGPIQVPRQTRRAGAWALDCRRPRLDFVQVIDGEGRLLEAISVFDALVESRYGPLLQNSDPCDPAHLNFVHQVREGAGGGAGVEAGDLVVSLRNLDAFGILDRGGHRLKRLVRGTFFRQHSVTHLEGTKFLMFDNQGGDGVHGPSRLLLVDVAEGTEHTVFPNGATPGHLQDLFSIKRGHVSVSPDRRRVFVTFWEEGRAVEVRLADGAVLSVFTNLHLPSSPLEAPSGERRTKVRRYSLGGVEYVAGHGVGE